MKRVAAIAMLLAAAPLAAAAQAYPDYGRPSYGAGRGDQDEARKAVQGGRQVPLAQVIGQIAAHTPGRQLNTTMGDYAGRPAYFVQWQTPDNRVIIFIVDAQTGQVVGRQGG
jgi:uncharacterized membrane protein YkoI